MSLPKITLYIGLDADIEIKGHGSAEFNFSSFDGAKFSSISLGIEKSDADPLQLEVTGSGANVKIHFLAADLAGKAPSQAGSETVKKWYYYQLLVQSGVKWMDVAGRGEVELIVKA